jgi:hypothetical protein
MIFELIVAKFLHKKFLLYSEAFLHAESKHRPDKSLSTSKTYEEMLSLNAHNQSTKTYDVLKTNQKSALYLIPLPLALTAGGITFFGFCNQHCKKCNPFNR